uniref:Uncharacterized protein n=1 Tax=Panagrolaimus sp. JU765 TaxID=591449 RepID=A0AC34QJF8_9BILA
MLQLFCLAKGIYYNPGFHNYNIICLEKNIKPGDFCSATFTGYDPDTNTFTVQTIPDQNPKIRHIPAKFSNGRYEFAIKLEIIREPVVMFYHAELGAVGFGEKMKPLVPPIKTFAFAAVTYHPEARSERNQKQNRLLVKKIVSQLEMLDGFV